MKLFQLREFDTNYCKAFGNAEIKQFHVYTDRGDQLGKVVDILSNETRDFYLVVKVGSWLTSKQVLLPLRQFQVDSTAQRIYVSGFNKAQVDNLPAYHPTTESRQENSRAESLAPISPLEASAPLEASVPLDIPLVLDPVLTPSDTQQEHFSEQSQLTPTVAPKNSPEPMQVLDTPSQTTSETVAEETIRLLEERLIVNSRKRKIGEVIVRKEIETRIVEVPIRREKLIIEQVSPEPKQLASIDLGQGEITGVELAEVANLASNPRAGGEFISVEVARQLLEDIAQQPDYQGANVQIIFKDAKLQQAYQQWLVGAGLLSNQSGQK